MGQYSYYDSQENVIFTDVSGLGPSRENTDAVLDEIIKIAKTLPSKVYVVVCWKDARMDAATADYYGKRVAEALNYVRGFVRYHADDVATRIAIRTETLKYRLQNSQSHLYATREEALMAVRERERLEKL